MSPTIVLANGAPVLALGSPGGATIITTVMQILVNHVDFKMPIDEALAAPRVSQRNAPNAMSSAEPHFLTSPGGLADAWPRLLGRGPRRDAGDPAPRGWLDEAVTEPVRRNGGSAMVVQPQ